MEKYSNKDSNSSSQTRILSSKRNKSLITFLKKNTRIDLTQLPRKFIWSTTILKTKRNNKYNQ